MLFIVGLIVVAASVLVGFAGAGGHLAVLWQPLELLIIFGAAGGAFLIANPRPVLIGTVRSAKKLLTRSKLSYFAPISTRPDSSGGGGCLAGESAAEKGNLDSRDETAKPAPPATDRHGFPAPEPEPLDEREERQLAAAGDAVRKAVGRLPNAEVLARSLLVDITAEGLRIQIVEQDGLPMFPRGQAIMYTHTLALREMVAKAILEMPQALAISGHTDALPFPISGAYSNWELSADRANAVRRSAGGKRRSGGADRPGGRQGGQRAAAARRPRGTGKPSCSCADRTPQPTRQPQIAASAVACTHAPET